jgi:hypothetical protein
MLDDVVVVVGIGVPCIGLKATPVCLDASIPNLLASWSNLSDGFIWLNYI